MAAQFLNESCTAIGSKANHDNVSLLRQDSGISILDMLKHLYKKNVQIYWLSKASKYDICRTFFYGNVQALHEIQSCNIIRYL